MSLDPEVRDAIDGLLRENRVVLFMKGNRAQPQCGFSAKTVEALDMILSDYQVVDVLKNPEVREGIKAYGNWPTIPQLYVAGELVGGCDIVKEMFDSGELGTLLGVSAPAPGRPPAIRISPAAMDIMQNALEKNPGKAICLRINGSWKHSLSLEATRPGSISVSIAPITIDVDTWSATRADGLSIDILDSVQGRGFRFDNPNAPAG
ncbi:MAG: Grx4 family monothiol glutaredoxin [Chromatiales bacterium]|jgi:monothiol glutaredoxin|nr:Grx4 family monothiol glutaredoxin [Chromatiales bacterium]